MIIPKRNIAIFEARKTGRTFRDIGLEHGLSVERTRQICVQVERRLARASEPEALDGLSVRVQNCLFNATGTHDLTPEEIAQLPASFLLDQYNFGKTSLAELRLWLQKRGLEMNDLPTARPLNSKLAETWAKALRKRGWTVIPPPPTNEQRG